MTRATPEGTRRFADRFRDCAETHWRSLDGLKAASIGLGTYLGDATDEHDALYEEAILRYLTSGGNVVDTAVNYRCQRSERCVGRALEAAVEAGDLSRDEVIISTKGGFIPYNTDPPRTRQELVDYIRETFIEPGVCNGDDIVQGCHCLKPSFLARELELSRENLGVDALDIYYLHNPETQLREVDAKTLYRRLRGAFEMLEEARAEGLIGCYGLATWNGFRVEPGHDQHLDLASIYDIATSVGGGDHGLRVIQLPYSMAQTEAWTYKTQQIEEHSVSTLEAARRLGLSVVISASLMQAKLADGLPPWLAEEMSELETDAQRSLQFVRSTPGVACGLVGMKSIDHVEENMHLAKIEALDEETFRELFEG